MSGLAVPYSASRQRAQSASKYGASESSTTTESDDRSSATSAQSAHKSKSSTAGRKDAKRQSLPTLESIPSQKPSPLRRRSSPSPLQPMKPVAKRMTKNYANLVKDFNELKKYARQSDGSFLSTTLCALCETAPPRLVFFPCQHRCVCDRCLFLNDITCEPTNASSWTACPVCMSDIKLMLPPTGNEETLYWKWALEVPPVLPLNFKDEFKDAGRRLRRNTSVVRPEQAHDPIHESTLRQETPEQHQSSPQQNPRSRRISQHSLRRFSLVNRRSSTTGSSAATAKLSGVESKCCML